MPDFLKLEPGLLFWSLVNFSIFVFIIARFLWKPMMNGLASREQAIKDNIAGAELANAEAQEVLRQAKERIANAQTEMVQIIRDGKQQAEGIIRKAAEEADAVKHQRLAEAQREIQRQKEEAIAELRAETAQLVVQATEKLLGRVIQNADHERMAAEYVKDIAKN